MITRRAHSDDNILVPLHSSTNIRHGPYATDFEREIAYTQHDLTVADVRRSLSLDDRGYLSGSSLSPTSAGKPGVERDQPSDLVQPEDGRVVRFSQMQCGLTDVDVDVSRSVLCDVDVDVVGVQRVKATNDQSMYHGTSQHH